MADVCEQWLGTDKGVKVTYNQHLTWLKYVFNVILVIVYFICNNNANFKRIISLCITCK